MSPLSTPGDGPDCYPGFQTLRCASIQWPHSDFAEPLPDMDIQAAKGSALVATPVSSLCQSSVFSAIDMSVRYTIRNHQWKPYLT